MRKRIVADTCFWFALFEPSDAHHDAAILLEEDLGIHQFVIPWPTLYETLNSRFFRKRHYLSGFKAIIEKPSTALIKIDALITFNAKDFRDVCDPRGVEMLYG